MNIKKIASIAMVLSAAFAASKVCGAVGSVRNPYILSLEENKKEFNLKIWNAARGEFLVGFSSIPGVATVGALKVLIAEQTEIPVRRQILCITTWDNGRVLGKPTILEDGRTLDQYENVILNNDRIDLFRK